MTAQLARFGISLIGLAAAFIIFMTTDVGWLSIAACFVVVIVAFIVAEMVFRRLADPETRRRDLEEGEGATVIVPDSRQVIRVDPKPQILSSLPGLTRQSIP